MSDYSSIKKKNKKNIHDKFIFCTSQRSFIRLSTYEEK